MIAIVTGGCSGLGLNYTLELLKKGYKVYALYNTSFETASILEKKYVNVKCVKCDIRDENDIISFLNEIDSVDLLINNAALEMDNSFKDKTKYEFMNVLETNIFGTFAMMKYVYDKMNNNGIIINMSSNNAIDNYNPISMDYDASKAAINILTKDFAEVYKEKNVKVFSICPGYINTESVKSMNPNYLKEEMDKVNQAYLIEPDKLVNYIFDNLDNFETASINVIKEVK